MIPRRKNTTSLPPADASDVRISLAEIRQVAGVMRKTKTLEERLRYFLTDDPQARAIFEKLLRKNISQCHVINIIEATSDPETGKRLQHELLPARDQGDKLVRHMRDAAKEIRLFWKPAGFFSLHLPQDHLAAHFAAHVLDEQAKGLKEIRWSLLTKQLGFRNFWSQLPIAMLCRYFDVPNVVTYTDLSHLLEIASWVRRSFGKDTLTSARNSPRALRQMYIRFKRRNQVLISRGALEAWVQLFTFTCSRVTQDSQ